MASKLYSYQGLSFDKNQLRQLSGRFCESYNKVVTQYASKPFVHVIEAHCEVAKTFSEFDQDVKRVTTGIKDLNCQVLVSVSGNTYINLVKMMAILLSGKTLVPINPEENDEMKARKLRALGNSVKILSDDDCNALLQKPASPDFQISERPGDIAMVKVFTSGSTGFGKVVVLSETNILSNIEATVRALKLTPNEKVATTLPIFHVNGFFFGFLSTFFSGAQFVLFEKLDLVQFTTSVKKLKASIVSLVPTIISLLIRSKNYIETEFLSEVKFVVTAASYLSPQHYQEFTQIFKTKLVQGYGLSEAVNFSTLMPIDLDSQKHDRIMIDGPNTCIGNAVFGNDLSILKEDLSEGTENEVGEVVIRGFNVMNGYLNDVEKKAFENDYFHTGDLGYFKVFDGQKFFYISGRIKDVVKRAGFTISLKEIDALASEMKLGQTDCIAFGMVDSDLGHELGLAMKFNSAELSNLDTAHLEAQIFAKFSNYMRPRLVLLTQKNLRTASGKPTRHIFSDKMLKNPIRLMTNQLLIQKDEL